MIQKPGEKEGSMTQKQDAKHISDGEELSVTAESTKILVPLAQPGASPQRCEREKTRRLEAKSSPKNGKAKRCTCPKCLRLPATRGGDENRVSPALGKGGRHIDPLEKDFCKRSTVRRGQVTRTRPYIFTREDEQLLRDIRTKVDCSLANGFGGNKEATRRLRMRRIFGAMANMSNSRIPEEVIKIQLEILDQEKGQSEVINRTQPKANFASDKKPGEAKSHPN